MSNIREQVAQDLRESMYQGMKDLIPWERVQPFGRTRFYAGADAAIAAVLECLEGEAEGILAARKANECPENLILSASTLVHWLRIKKEDTSDHHPARP